MESWKLSTMTAHLLPNFHVDPLQVRAASYSENPPLPLIDWQVLAMLMSMLLNTPEFDAASCQEIKDYVLQNQNEHLSHLCREVVVVVAFLINRRFDRFVCSFTGLSGKLFINDEHACLCRVSPHLPESVSSVCQFLCSTSFRRIWPPDLETIRYKFSCALSCRLSEGQSSHQGRSGKGCCQQCWTLFEDCYYSIFFVGAFQ